MKTLTHLLFKPTSQQQHIFNILRLLLNSTKNTPKQTYRVHQSPNYLPEKKEKKKRRIKILKKQSNCRIKTNKRPPKPNIPAIIQPNLKKENCKLNPHR